MRTALITGATSGFGAAASRAFVAAGWRVIGTGRRADRLDALKAELGDDKFHPAVFDVRDEAARDAALAAELGLREGDLVIGKIARLFELKGHDDVFAIAREMVAEVDHPILGRLKTVGTPIKMSETPLNPGRRAPMLGEHTDEVLANAGYSGDEIEQLRYAGAAL